MSEFLYVPKFQVDWMVSSPKVKKVTIVKRKEIFLMVEHVKIVTIVKRKEIFLKVEHVKIVTIVKRKEIFLKVKM